MDDRFWSIWSCSNQAPSHLFLLRFAYEPTLWGKSILFIKKSILLVTSTCLNYFNNPFLELVLIFPLFLSSLPIIINSFWPFNKIYLRTGCRKPLFWGPTNNATTLKASRRWWTTWSRRSTKNKGSNKTSSKLWSSFPQEKVWSRGQLTNILILNRSIREKIHHLFHRIAFPCRRRMDSCRGRKEIDILSPATKCSIFRVRGKGSTTRSASLSRIMISNRVSTRKWVSIILAWWPGLTAFRKRKNKQFASITLKEERLKEEKHCKKVRQLSPG